MIEPEAQPQGEGPRIRTATIRICQACVDLVGEECHTPECVFCFRSVTEAKRLMDKMMIAPIIDGERFVLVDDADLPRATANDGYQWGPLLEQAERIVKTWRATDQHDKLLVHYIAQAIRDNATPRATGEIEAALAELREIYPKRWINVICATHSAQQVATKTTWTVSIDQLVDDFEGPSLADCMAQVRAARTEGGREK